MRNKIEREYNLRVSDFDKFRRIRPAAVLDLFQDIAGIHAVDLGCGYGDLLEQKMMWVLVRVKFTVVSNPIMYSKVLLETWPLEPSRIGFRREYKMSDNNGNILIKGSSEWVIVHSEERRFLPVKDIYPIKEGFCQEQMHTEKLSKLKDFEPNMPQKAIVPRYSDIDMNGHVNNIKYMDYVIDSIASDSPLDIKSVSIDYKKEILPETEIMIQCKKEEDIIEAKGTDEDNNIMFVCKIEL